MGRPRVYVSGPYSLPDGDQLAHTERAIGIGQMLLEAGFAPMVPHCTHWWHAYYPNDYNTWLELDLAWVEATDAVLRLSGDSRGADKEVALAKRLGIPVFYKIQELVNWAEAGGRLS
jgi:hypothetical protein